MQCQHPASREDEAEGNAGPRRNLPSRMLLGGPWIAALGLVVAATFLLGLRCVYSPDLGFHLRTGAWILENARFPGREVFSYTVPRATYVDLYWLYQVLQASLERIGGWPLIIVFNAALIVATIAITAVRAFGRSSRHMYALPLLLLLGVNVMSFETRPQVLSCLLLSLVLLVLERHARDETAPLWPLPILFLLWINTHPLAVLGLLAVGVFFVGTYLEHRKVDGSLALFAALSAAAFLVTPYGLKGVSVPLMQFGFLQSGSAFKSAIGEYVSPFTLHAYQSGGAPFFLQAAFILHLLSAIALVAGVMCVRQRAWRDLLLIAVFLCVFALAVKNFEYFFFVTLPVVVDRLPGARTDTKRQARRSSGRSPRTTFAFLLEGRRARGASILAAVLLALATITSTVTGSWYVFWRADVRGGLSLDPLHVPYRAIDFLNQKGLRGRVFNDMTSGGWLLRFRNARVFVDGRNEVYGDRFLRMLLGTYRNPLALESILAEYHPDIALFDYMKTPQWLAFFLDRKDWRLAYADDHSVVWLRNGYADEVAAAAAPAGYDSSEVSPPVLETIRRKYPAGIGALCAAFTSRQYYPWSEYQESLLAYQMGWLEVAKHVALAGLGKSTVPSKTLLFNAGQFLYLCGDREGARAAYARLLELDPRDVEARRRLAALGGT
jgi:hypothetical protein